MAKRGFYRKSARHPEGSQKEMLIAAGYATLYTEGKDETVMHFASSARAKEVIGVPTLGRLASSRDAIRAAVEKIFEKGAIIHEVATGRRSDKAHDMALMMADAADEIGADKKVHGHAASVRNGSKGGRPELPDRMDDDDAKPIWYNVKRYPKPEDAVPHMHGFSVSTAYKRLGARGSPAGRKSKRKRHH